VQRLVRWIQAHVELAAARGMGVDRMPLPKAHSLARGIARGYFALGGRRVRWARQNLRLAFPTWSEAEREQVARESAANVLCSLIDLRRSERWTSRDLLAHFGFEGLEHLDAALASGRGALLLSLHLGCYDLGLRALSLRYPRLRTAVISKPLRSPFLQAWLYERRNGGEVELIPPGRSAGLRALRVLRAGRPLIVLNDLYVRSGRRVEVPLFGKRCLTSTGPAVLARTAPAAILPCYVLRDAPDHHTFWILPELDVAHCGEDSDLAVTEACNAALEGIIRKHPEQWTWAHRRFRYSPDLPQGLYRPSAKRASV
jgi:KDO2-lipid IV(A) lauroyltransferase